MNDISWHKNIMTSTGITLHSTSESKSRRIQLPVPFLQYLLTHLSMQERSYMENFRQTKPSVSTPFFKLRGPPLFYGTRQDQCPTLTFCHIYECKSALIESTWHLTSPQSASLIHISSSQQDLIPSSRTSQPWLKKNSVGLSSDIDFVCK